MTTEFQQVAALLTLDIDLLNDVADEQKTAEELLWLIRDLVAKKNDMVENADSRNNRYAAAEAVYGLTAKHP
jgi:hypothetical protein